MIAIVVFAITGGFVLGRVTAPGPDRLIQSAEQRLTAVMHDAVIGELTEGRIGRISAAGVAPLGDRAIRETFQDVLRPAPGAPAWITVHYINNTGRQLVFANPSDTPGEQWGQVYVFGYDGGVVSVTEEFARRPERRAELIGQQVAIDPGDRIEVLIIADGDESDDTIDWAYGVESVTLREGRPARAVTLALPTPIVVHQPAR